MSSNRAAARFLSGPFVAKLLVGSLGTMVRFIRRWMRQLTCNHHNRVLESIFREPIGYTRRAQYYCPDCKRLWASGQMPEGI